VREAKANIMKPQRLTTTVCVSAAAILGLASCEVKKTQEGNLPEVKTEGEVQLPKSGVQGPDVEVGSKKVEVPTIDIQTPQEQREEEAKQATPPE
jgi:hypothetical protein